MAPLNTAQALWLVELFSVLLLVTGLYCIIVSSNLIRILLGVELVTKGVTLLLVAAGYVIGRVALGQSLIITLILVEVVVIVVAAGIVIGSFRQSNSLNIRQVSNLKG